MKKTTRLMALFGLGLICLYLILLIPDSEPRIEAESDSAPFLWNQDAYWESLESSFLAARQMDSTARADAIRSLFQRLEIAQNLDFYAPPDPSSQFFDTVETDLFQLGVLVAAAPENLPELVTVHTSMRRWVKGWSQYWDLSDRPVRDRLYRLLYGIRGAVEEVMLQADPAGIPELSVGIDEPSATPSAELLSVKIHSGDVLVSRGGAATSALIARGNDYPGNFSHVALAHVDEETGELSIIESHIELGVAVAAVEDYLRDTKLRILALRLRADHPAIQDDPMLPHEVATLALERARREHIPYDFAMDFQDNSALFCSEVASDPYQQKGVTLWMGISRISSPGVRNWLAAFGVTNFVTQEPSDLEYDPQLRVVAEWRDPETLWQDHLDNALIDAMLEGAEQGDRLDYEWHLLPMARLLKAWSYLKTLGGGVGPIPEGMSATAALKNDLFSARHAAARKRLESLASVFQEDNGYRPPYWELLKLARVAVAPSDE